MSSLEEIIKKAKPNISDSTVRTYKSVITNTFKKLNPSRAFNHEWFYSKENAQKVFDHLKDANLSSRKTTLAGLTVISDGKDIQKEYRDRMMVDSKKYSEEGLLQRMNEKQQENHMPMEEVRKIYVRVETIAKMLWNLPSRTMTQFQDVQNFIMMACMCGIFIEPRRLMDWRMKIRGDIDEKKENYIDHEKKQFIFNDYKTKGSYGAQRIDIPKPLMTILKKWISINPYDCLLVDVKGGCLTQSAMNLRLNNILGKRVGINGIRHSYLTELYKDLPALKEIKERADKMGHSIETALSYVKLDAPK
jgi:integrase